jgi:hypothetical protein
MNSLAKSPHGRYTRNKGEKHPLFSRTIISTYPGIDSTSDQEKTSLSCAICGTPAFSATMPSYVKYLEGNMAKQMYAQTTIFSLECIYINGGKHGFLLEISSADLHTTLPVQEVDVQTDRFPC